MNIFYIDPNPGKCAKYMVDRHVVKMILETAQLLCTAHRVLDGEVKIVLSDKGRKNKRYCLSDARESILYKATHINHPSNVWVRANTSNYEWLYKHFIQLLNEYKYRYNKNHKCEFLISTLKEFPINMPHGNFSDPPCAMDNIYIISENSVDNYRNYYIHGKKHLHSWKNREKPKWMNE